MFIHRHYEIVSLWLFLPIKTNHSLNKNQANRNALFSYRLL